MEFIIIKFYLLSLMTFYSKLINKNVFFLNENTMPIKTDILNPHFKKVLKKTKANI